MPDICKSLISEFYTDFSSIQISHLIKQLDQIIPPVWMGEV